MLQSGPAVSLEDVRERDVDLTCEEAIAIVLQLGRRLSWHIAPPPPSGILLGGDGSVDVRWPHGADPATAAAFAALLHQLLPEPCSTHHAPVPGALRVLVARALATTALPPIVSAREFAAALDRFVEDPAGEAIPARVAAVAHRTIAAGLPVAARSRARERRVSGPSVTELRRQLQEADLARYFLLSQLGQRAGGQAAGMAFMVAPPRSAASRRPRPFSLRIDAPGRETPRLSHERGRSEMPVARGVRIVAFAALLVVCVVTDEQRPVLPQPPPLQHADELPALPVPFALLAAPAPTPVVADHPDAPAVRKEASVQDAAEDGPSAKPQKAHERRPNRFLRFVKSLFEA